MTLNKAHKPQPETDLDRKCYSTMISIVEYWTKDAVDFVAFEKLTTVYI